MKKILIFQFLIFSFLLCFKDLDGDKTISFHEFYLLTKHIEKELFSEKFVMDIFEENFDIVKNEEKILSFDKFAAVCVDYLLFSNEK